MRSEGLAEERQREAFAATVCSSLPGTMDAVLAQGVDVVGPNEWGGVIVDPPMGALLPPEPIAVMDAQPFEGEEASDVGPSIDDTLRRDLGLVGWFQLVPPSTGEWVEPTRVALEDWRFAGARWLIEAIYADLGETVRLDFRLFDFSTESTIDLGLMPVVTSRGDVEATVHDFVNRIIEYFIGVPGPFGTRIAASCRGQDGTQEICVVTVGGDEVQQVTRDGGVDVLPQWVGDDVIYTSLSALGAVLTVSSLDGRAIRSLTHDGLAMAGSLSPDGEVMLASLSFGDNNADIVLLAPDTLDVVARLTDDPADDIEPTWSPDGSRIAFVSDRSGEPQIYTMSRDGTDPVRLTWTGPYNTGPDWSPDGRAIVFTGRDGTGTSDVFTVDPETAFVRRLTQGEGDNEGGSWSPNGSFLTFTSTRGGDGPHLYLMDNLGYPAVRLTCDRSGHVAYSTPHWQH